MGNIFDCSTEAKVPAEGDIQDPAGAAMTFETNHFDANVDVSDELVKQLAASDGDKRVLLLIGGDWCIWSVRFCELLKSDDAIQAALAANFHLMCVNFNANRSLCHKWAPKIQHTPWLAVVDGTGKVIAEQVSAPSVPRTRVVERAALLLLRSAHPRYPTRYPHARALHPTRRSPLIRSPDLALDRARVSWRRARGMTRSAFCPS